MVYKADTFRKYHLFDLLPYIHKRYSMGNRIIENLNQKISKWNTKIRDISLKLQRLHFGFSLTDLWCLDFHLTNFILPRLKAFRDFGPGFEEFEEPWDVIINRMILGFELAKKDTLNGQERAQMEEGFQTFARYYRALWW